MNYAYFRVSTDKQDTENQKSGIMEYAATRNIRIDEFVEDVVPGSKDWRGGLWTILYVRQRKRCPTFYGSVQNCQKYATLFAGITNLGG